MSEISSRARDSAVHRTEEAVLGKADGALRQLERRSLGWTLLGAMWGGIIAMLLVAAYPLPRVLVVVTASLLLEGVVPVVVWIHDRRTNRSWREARRWASMATYLLMVALTGGLHSPVAPILFILFASLLLDRSVRKSGYGALPPFLVAVLAIALLPARWLGPPVPEPYFTAIVLYAASIMVGLHIWLLVALRRIASTAMADAIRAREDLADHARARARELESVGTRLSHELKNPLGAIKTLVQVSRRQTTDSTLQEHLAVVESEVERMTRIVTSHLDFSRPRDPLWLEPVQLAQVVASVLGALRGTAVAARVRLLHVGDARVTADVHRLEEALFNVVDNAIEACAGGGVVQVTVEERDHAARLVVRDSGRGMSAEVLARLGTPFFTTREQGTGLGVVLARAVFAQHGGTLEYSSTPGEGTTAIGSLPSATAVGPASAPSPPNRM